MKIENISQLRALYNLPNERAQKKQLSALDVHAINFIKKSPFAIMATFNHKGQVDASPRGGNPGFVKVLNEREFVMPDAKGNNRLDSMTNILDNGRIGLLFLIPGIDETLRVNGSAAIHTDKKLLDNFITEKNPPKVCLLISVEEVFLHCAKALMRSKLWLQDSLVNRDEMPSMGQMLKDQTGLPGCPEAQQAMLTRYKKDL